MESYNISLRRDIEEAKPAWGDLAIGPQNVQTKLTKKWEIKKKED